MTEQSFVQCVHQADEVTSQVLMSDNTMRTSSAFIHSIHGQLKQMGMD